MKGAKASPMLLNAMPFSNDYILLCVFFFRNYDGNPRRKRGW